MPLAVIEDWAKRSDEPVEATANGSVVLVSLREKKYFALNATAAAIWKKLERPIQLCQIRDEIAKEFEFGSTQQSASDAVLEFVTRLSEENMVKLQSDPFDRG